MSFRVALAVDNFAGVEEVGHLCFLSPEGQSVSCNGFVVVRLVLKNTVLLALSRWFLVFVVAFLGAVAARKPQLCRPLVG